MNTRSLRPHYLFIAAVLALTPSCAVYFGGEAGGQVYARTYAGNIPLTLINDTGVAACYVHMGPSADRNWGDDWLGPTETIPPGAARTFQVAGGYTWDIRVNTCGHVVMSEAQQIPVLGPVQLVVSSLRPVVGVPAQPQPVYVAPLQPQGPQQMAPVQVYVQPQPVAQQPAQVQVYVQPQGAAPVPVPPSAQP